MPPQRLPHRRPLAVVAALLGWLSLFASAQEVTKTKEGFVRGSIVFAVADPADARSDATARAPRAEMRRLLAKAFPEYRHFQLLREEVQPVYQAYESWVFPNNRLMLKLDSRGKVPAGGMRVDIQLWQGTKVLVKTETVVSRTSPVVIEGPAWGKGKLLFVVTETDAPRENP